MMGHRMDLQVSSESVLGEKKLIVSMTYNRGRSQSLASNIPSNNSGGNNTNTATGTNTGTNVKAKKFDKIRHESFERYPIPTSTTSTATYQSNLNSEYNKYIIYIHSIKNINVIIAKGPDGTNGFKLKRRNSLPDN